MPQPYILIPATGADPADEWIRLGTQAHVEGKLDAAETNYRNAIRLDPKSIVATQNLAVVFATKGNLNEALLTIERAAIQDGHTAHLHSNHALICLEADRIDEGMAAADRAIRIAEENPTIAFPDPYVQALFAKALVSGTAGKPQIALEAYEEILSREPLHPAAGPNSCFVQTLLPSDAEQLSFYRKRYAAVHRPQGLQLRGHSNDRSPERVLRVGYVGGDFKTHSAAMIFGNVLLNHDSRQVEHYLYSSLPVNAEQDEFTKRFFASVTPPNTSTRWRDIVPLTDDQAAELVRQDRIDILVDLAAHTSGGRLGLFLRKPAPVQVTAWGFAHGTGLDEVDYFLADPVAVPIDERQHYAERIVDLPCIVTYSPPLYQIKHTSTVPMMSRGYFTFGSYARYEKLSDGCLRAFAEILRRVPDSKLQFKDHAFRRPYSIRRVMGFMDGIDPNRLLFSISTNHQDHLLAYQQCDLCLDPWPHGGGVVFLEQMWMGVPTLTLRGKQPAGRTASSVLTALGREGWIAENEGDFVVKAILLAEQPKELIAARKTLHDEFAASPVVSGYAQAVEAAYRTAWKGWCSG